MPNAARIHLVYIPGLGDGLGMLRWWLLSGNWGKGVVVSLVPMMWRNADDTVEAKLERIKTAIQKVPAEKTVLLGESAGAAMVVVAQHKLKNIVDGAISICGKHLGSNTVGPQAYRRNPSFRVVMEQGEAIARAMSSDNKTRLKILYSSQDMLIPPQDTLIPGVEAVDMRTRGHKRSIMTTLLFRRRVVVKLAESIV